MDTPSRSEGEADETISSGQEAADPAKCWYRVMILGRSVVCIEYHLVRKVED
jgi:hypothetical protein